MGSMTDPLEMRVTVPYFGGLPLSRLSAAGRRRPRRTALRWCADCSADISRRGNAAKRCEPCAKAAERRQGSLRHPENPERKREQGRRWRTENPEKHRESVRRCRAANPERARQQQRRRYAANPEPTRERARRRTARSGGPKPRRYRFLLYVIQGGRCGICHKEMDGFGGDEMHVDHIIPLALGGPDIFANWQAAHAFCNLAKGDSGRPLPDNVRRMIREQVPFMPPIDEQIADVLDIEADSRVR